MIDRHAPQSPTDAGPKTILSASDESRIELSILIVGFQSADLIAHCISAIPAACTNHVAEILLVDNGDGSTEEFVRKSFPKVRIVASRGNIGFAAGNNWLARHAKGAKLLLLNPDMVLAPGAIDALMEGSERYPDAAAWGGVTVDPQGRLDTGNFLTFPTLMELASAAAGRSLSFRRSPSNATDDACVDVLVGGLMLIDRQAWDALGGFDERYFLYAEEIDLFLRFSNYGYTVWRIPEARGEHHASHGNHLSPMRLLYRAAGNQEFFRAHWSIPARMLATALVWLAALERYAAGRLLGAWKPGLARLGEGYRHVALRPGYWVHGYDKDHGLLAKLSQESPL